MSPSQWAAFVHQLIIDGHDGYILGIQPCYVTYLCIKQTVFSVFKFFQRFQPMLIDKML